MRSVACLAPCAVSTAWPRAPHRTPTCGFEATPLHADAAVAHPALLWVLLLVAVGAQPAVLGHLLPRLLQDSKKGGKEWEASRQAASGVSVCWACV